jgi:cell division protease FtsH
MGDFIKKYKWTLIIMIIIATLLTIGTVSYLGKSHTDEAKTISVTKFLRILNSNEIKDLKKVKISGETRELSYLKDDKKYRVEFPKGNYIYKYNLLEKFSKSNVDVDVQYNKSILDILSLIFVMLFNILFFTSIIFIIFYFAKNFKDFFGEGELEEITEETTTFQDIAGYKYVKEELREIIDFLNEPKKYEKYTKRLPKGILFEGPPGNGKTLLAKALAGETKTAFFQISAADIESMFVGGGARKIDKIFKKVKEKVKKKGKAILFIDEIDAVGLNRENRTVVETNQTINKLLTELDGFDKNTNILVIAATNLASVLDPALTRSGRFDRIITIPQPNVKDRKEIIELYLGKRKEMVDEQVFKENYPNVLAQQTEGFCNADLDKLINEASLIARKRNKNKVDIECLRESFTKVVAGIKIDHFITEEERKIIAYHEAGHAVTQIITSKLGYKSVAYITITPYGQSLGHVSPVSENKVIMHKSDLENNIKMLLSGRAVEERILNGDFTTGAMNDLQQANGKLLNYVTKYGMSEFAENLFIEKLDENTELVQNHLKIIRDRIYKETKEIIEKHYDMVEKIAEHLLKNESIDQPELKELIKNTSFEQK